MTNNKPLVSIVLPTYNRAHLIGNSIESCLMQTYENFELIIVDDGSADNTQQIAEEYAAKDNRIKYFKKENGKLPRALNYGFERVQGEYLTWTSDDNKFAPEAIEEMVAFSEKQNKHGLIYANSLFYYNDTGKKVVWAYPPEELHKRNVISACFMYHKSTKDEVGDYDPNLFLIEDYDYWLRIAKKFPVYHLDKTLYTVSIHKETLTKTRENQIKFLYIILQRRHRLVNKFIFSLKLFKKFLELAISKDSISSKIDCLKFVFSKLYLAE